MATIILWTLHPTVDQSNADTSPTAPQSNSMNALAPTLSVPSMPPPLQMMIGFISLYVASGPLLMIALQMSKSLGMNAKTD